MKKHRKAPQTENLPTDALVSATEMTGLQPFLQQATAGENPSNAELIPIPFAKVPEDAEK